MGLLLSTLGAAVLMAIVAWVALTRIEDRARAETGNALAAALQTTQQALHDWHEERAGDIRLWARTPALLRSVEKLVVIPRDQAALRQSPVQAEIRAVLGPVVAEYGYQGFFIISPQGLNLASSRDVNIGVTSLLVGGAFERMLSQGPVVSLPQPSDVRLSGTEDDAFAIEPTMFVGGPVVNGEGKTLALLAFRLDPVRDFTKILKRSQLGESGETYAFDRHGLLISDIRFPEPLREIGLISPGEPDILNLQIRDPGGDLSEGYRPGLPRDQQPLTVMAANAITGSQGQNVEGYRNYRGTRVIGAWTWEDDLGAGIATEISFAEAYGFLETTQRLLLGTITFAVSLMFGIVMLFLVNRRRIAESEANLTAIFETASDGILAIDDKGTVERINQAAVDLFGYQREEVIGRNIKMLMPDSYQAKHDSYLMNYLATGVRKIIGIGREVEGLRKDGSVFSMELTVAESYSGQRRRFVGTVRDITEKKRMDRMKTEFISTVSHELRTPLTSIRGSLGLISGGAVGDLPEQAMSMVGLAQRNTERLIGLVNDILDMEKIDSGAMEFSFETVDMAVLISQAVEANHGFADQFDVEFIYVKPASEIYVHGDAGRLTQVLNNLLSNAAKFSPAGEKIEIDLSVRGDVVRVSVSDHGPGIPDDFRDRVFQRFSQVDSSDARKVGGTGLGLNISKSIIDRHGGFIACKSVSAGGAAFYFDLPLKRLIARDTPYKQQEGTPNNLIPDNDDRGRARGATP